MDHSKTATHVSLCAGYGGIDLGLKRVVPHLRTVAFSEIEAFACANLVGKMEAGLLDAAPIWTDVRTFPWASFHGKVDILSGGYPCQPFSAAGKRLGREDPRHLWPWIADGISLMQPRVCFFENVEGHISLGLREVVEELAGMGYRTTWGIFSAAEIGAPHQRKRVFILAHGLCQRGQLQNWWQHAGQQEPERNGEAWGNVWPSRSGQPQHGWEPPRVVVNPSDTGRSQLQQSKRAAEEYTGLVQANAAGIETQPALGGDADGPAGGLDYAELCQSSDNRTDELRLLGNGVVPSTAARAFSVLMEELLNDA